MDKELIENHFRGNYIKFYSHFLSEIKPGGNGQSMVQCPFHEDHSPSLSINLESGLFHCFGCNADGDIFTFYAKTNNLTLTADFSKVLAGIAKDFNIHNGNGDTRALKPTLTARYDYKDESGTLLYQIERLEPGKDGKKKEFRFKRHDGIYKKEGVRIVPYRLPEILKVDEIIIVEGEKDVDNLVSLGLVTTCNPFGAGKWPDDFGPYFKGKTVTIITDNDEPGRAHGRQVYKNIKKGAWEIKLLELPDLPEKGDVSDFIVSCPDKPEAIKRLTVLIADAPFFPEPVEPVNLSTMEVDPWTEQTFTLKDAYAPREPLKHIVAGLFTLPSLSIVYGAPGVLKSLLMGLLAVFVAAGLPCLGRAVIQSAVLWIDFDNGKRRSHERFEALGRGAGLPETVPFYYVSMPNPWLNAGNQEDIDALCNRIIEQGIKFVIVDNLGLISPGKDENSGEMIYVMSNLRALSERTGAAIVVIHHQRKTNGQGRIGESLRGHSSIEAAIDLALLVEREEGSNTITIRSTKTRDVDVPPFAAEFYFEHRPGTDELAKAGFTLLEIEDKKSDQAIEKAILNYIRDNPQVTQKQVIDAIKPELEAGVNRIRDIYNSLKEKGRLNA